VILGRRLLLERGGKVVTKHIESADRPTHQSIIRAHRDEGAATSTDVHRAYQGSSAEYQHSVVHDAVDYVERQVHTNGSENFWSLLKRTIGGTGVSVEAFHSHRYLDELAFRYNNPKDTDGGRHSAAVEGVAGQRLTYKQLTG